MNDSFNIKSTGFYTSDLSIQFLNVKIKRTCSFFGKEKNPYYAILYAQKGSYHILSAGKSRTFDDGDIAIFMPFESYQVLAEKGTENDLVSIDFNKDIFKFNNDDENFLRAFAKREKGKSNIFKKSEFYDFNMQESIFTPLLNYKKSNLDINQFIASVSFLVSQLGYYFDKKNNIIPAQNSNEYRVIIYDYILRNFNTDITVESVAEKFYVSTWYVNKITKEFYNNSFHQTIKSLRMWASRKLIKENNSLKDVSRLCGYSSYSGFYRCYLKYFGVSPVDDKIEYNKNGKFLSKT